MSIRITATITSLALVVAHLLTANGAVASDTAIPNPNDAVNKHFEEASKYFGDGVAQLHSRQEGAAGTTHSVYQFDCFNKTYHPLYSAGLPPDQLPLGMGAGTAAPLEPHSAIAPLAQHTCTKHGHPLLEW